MPAPVHLTVVVELRIVRDVVRDVAGLLRDCAVAVDPGAQTGALLLAERLLAAHLAHLVHHSQFARRAREAEGLWWAWKAHRRGDVIAPRDAEALRGLGLL